MCFIVGQKVSIRLNRSAYVASYGRPTDMNFLTKAEPLRKPKWERAFSECPKCGARGRCDKHGLTASGIHIEDMKQLALTTKSWTTWHRTMTDWINGDEGE